MLFIAVPFITLCFAIGAYYMCFQALVAILESNVAGAITCVALSAVMCWAALGSILAILEYGP